MFLKSLELINYRNYERCFIDFTTDKTVLIGQNAQGKTNILESIYYMATLSSYRAKNDSELVLWGKDFLRIKGKLLKFDTDIELEALLNPPNKKTLKVNGTKKTKYSQFVGNLIIVNFSVNDLLLLRGTPQDRRKWLDDSISQIYPAYIERLARYNKIRVQRNNLLKSFKGNINILGYQNDSLEVWNEQLIIAGSNLVYLRQKYLKEIQERALKKHKSISVDENLLIKYNSTVTGDFNSLNDNPASPEKIASLYKEKLAVKRNEEIIRAQTLIGSHRDDISFFINEVDAKSFASQGQQRTVVLSLKLAELELIKDKIGENPVLLMDDVLAELDQSRQNYLLNSIGDGIQTIITSVDILSFKPEFLKDVRVLKIENGTVVD